MYVLKASITTTNKKGSHFSILAVHPKSNRIHVRATSYALSDTLIHVNDGGVFSLLLHNYDIRPYFLISCFLFHMFLVYVYLIVYVQYALCLFLIFLFVFLP